MPLRGPPDGRYGGAESPGRPSRERVDPGKADTAPKAAPGSRSGLSCSLPSATSRGAVVLIRAPGNLRLPMAATGPGQGESSMSPPGLPAHPGSHRSPLARDV